MASNEEFAARLQEQINLLKGLEDAVKGAIGRAENRMIELKAGKPIKDVFVAVPPEQ